MKQRKEEFILSAQTIDRLSQLLVTDLTNVGTDKQDILRIRLSLEEILGMWLEQSEGVACTGGRFGNRDAYRNERSILTLKKQFGKEN